MVEGRCGAAAERTPPNDREEVAADSTLGAVETVCSERIEEAAVFS